MEKNNKKTFLTQRITFDGINWWLSVGIEYTDNIEMPANEGIGIDFGIKNLAICRYYKLYKNINKTQKIRKEIVTVKQSSNRFFIKKADTLKKE